MKRGIPVHMMISVCLAFLLTAFRNDPRTETSLNVFNDSVFPTAKAFKGKMIETSDSNVRLRLGTDNDFLLADTSKKYIYMYVDATFIERQDNQKLPLNLCIVIDKSGSMEGIKMGNAKKAARAIIDQLQPEDILSIVSFDSYVDTVMGPAHITDKEKTKKKISSIVPQGGTNLWGGTQKGFDFVRMNNKPGYINRVLLLSDGGANIGITNSDTIIAKVKDYKEKEGISISTFGIGLDFNERLLTEMALVAAGNFYYISQPEQIGGDMIRELKSISKPVARDVEISITIPESLKLIVAQPYQVSNKNHSMTINWQNVFAGEEKPLLLKFVQMGKPDHDLIFKTTLSYVQNRTYKKYILTVNNTIKRTNQKEDYNTYFNKTVIEKALLYTASEHIDQALNKTDENKIKDAVDILRTNTIYLNKHKSYLDTGNGLATLDSLNKRFFDQLNSSANVPSDSLKKLQKRIRTANFSLRNPNESIIQ